MVHTNVSHRMTNQFNNIANKQNLASVSRNTKLAYQKALQSQKLVETLITKNNEFPLDNYILDRSGVVICPDRGASIPSLILNGTEIFYNDPDQRNDQSKSLREGFWMGPQAGPFTPEQNSAYGYNLHQHGFLRDVARKKGGTREKTIGYDFEMDENTLQQFPHAFKVSESIALGQKGAHISLSIQNNGSDMMRFAPGHHTYYKVAPNQKNNIQLSENMGVSDEMKEKRISGKETIKILNPGSCQMFIPGTGLLQLDFDLQFKYIRLRSQKDKGFVCAEPVVCHPSQRETASLDIKPGEKAELGFTITLVST